MQEERRERKRETEEERAARKERERKERSNETEDQRRERKAREAATTSKSAETEEERAARKERERKERSSETEEQRRERKAREAAAPAKAAETEEERAARKERERKERSSETEDQRRERKAREAASGAPSRPRETEEERAARKERERNERNNETEDQRRERKAREAAAPAKAAETEEERAARKERERKERSNETEDQRRERKAREADKKDHKKEVVHKALPQTLAQQSQNQQQQAIKPKSEPVVQARNPNLPPAQPISNEPDEYDDEDFEDGFDDDVMEGAQKAVLAENADVRKNMFNVTASSANNNNGTPPVAGAKGGSPVPERGSPAVVVGQSRFGADDLQRQKYRAQFEKDLARATALRRLVDLDDVTAVIADIPPLSEYDMYIRNFGGTGRSQAGMQAPALEDKIDIEVQADRVTTKSKGAQCPEDLGLFPERAAALSTVANEDGDNAAAKKNGPASVDATLLSSFLSRVFPVMRTLLDEAHFGHGANVKKSSIPVSDSYTTFAAKETLGRPVQRIVYNPTAPQYVLCLHGPKTGHASAPEKRLPADRSDGLAVVWNINDQTMPDKLLTNSCALNAACFSPSRPHLVYGGGQDGAVCIWDLRETDSLHASDDKQSTITLRAPSFTTEWQHENHKSPIVQICVAGYNSMLGSRKDENDQLVTLDRDGTVHFWMVNDGTGSGGAAGSSTPAGGSSGGKQSSLSDQDHGQLMGACVRCFRATTLSVGRSLPTKHQQALSASTLSYESPQSSSGFVGNAFDFDFCPADPSRFVVAAGAALHHMSRFSSIAAPSSYGPHSQFFGDAASAPSSCSFSTLDSRILIGGYSDGTVRVYLRDEALPQLSIVVSPTPIRQVQTSNTIKLMTFALDENGVFFVLDHGIDEKEVPVIHCSAGTQQTGRCTSFAIPLEDKGNSQLAFGFEDGSVQLHTLNDKWLAPAHTRSERWL